MSEYLIYKFSEESHLSAEKVAQKRHEELLKNNQAYVFFYKWSKDFLIDSTKVERMSEDDFNSIEKNLIKSLKKEVLSKDDIDFRFAYYKMLFDPVLDIAEKAIKQYVKVIKAADTESMSEEELTCRIVELFESDLINKLTE